MEFPADPTTSTVSRELRDRIRHVIEPYRTTPDKPPFTVEQLMVMALVDGGEMKAVGIQQWILDNLAYYRRLGDIQLQLWLQPERIHSTLNREWLSFQKLFKDAFWFNSVPLNPSNDFGNCPSVMFDEFHTSCCEAQLFLEDAMDKHIPGNNDEGRTRKKLQPFPFMRLPAELRFQVFEMCFRFPPSGLRVAPKDHSCEVLTRDFGFPLDFGLERWCDIRRSFQQRDSPAKILGLESWCNIRDNVLECDSPAKIFALLSTSKQIYREALPVFYNVNTFICLSVEDLQFLLSHTAPNRRQHFRHIFFEYDFRWRPRRPNTALCENAFGLLGSLDGLQKLGIKIYEDTWIPVGNPSDKDARYSDISQLPGISLLRSLRNLDLYFQGWFCEFRDYLEPVMIEETESMDAD